MSNAIARSAHRKLRLTRGSAYVEFALTLVPFLIFMFGIINCALAIYAYSFVSYAAREATRFAAVRGASSAGPATAAEVTGFVNAEAYGVNPGKLNVTTIWKPDNNPGSAVRVTVNYQFDFAIPFVNLGAVNLSSTSQMVIMQ